MPGLQIRRESHRDGTTLHLEGVFDKTTAMALRQMIEEMSERSITLDFARVRTFVDVAVGVLTPGFGDRRIRLEGLPRHQERMFRYFGLTFPPPSPTLLAG